METTWHHLSFLPSSDALAALTDAWSWRLPDEFRPVLASTLGDVFFQQLGPEVYWLNTGTAEIRQVADSRADFIEALKTDQRNLWFMPSLVEALIAAGKTLAPDHCYTWVVLPVFKECTYDVTNLNPVPAADHFRATGAIHQRISDLPDGARVRIVVTP